MEYQNIHLKEKRLRKIVIIDAVFDDMNNCSYLIFKDADEHFQLQVSKDIGKRAALLLYNAFPLDEKSIYSSFVRLVDSLSFKIDSVVLTADLKSEDTAKLVISQSDKTVELLMDSDDAILVALISRAAIFIDNDSGYDDVENDLISNWCNFFSKVL